MPASSSWLPLTFVSLSLAPCRFWESLQRIPGLESPSCLTTIQVRFCTSQERAMPGQYWPQSVHLLLDPTKTDNQICIFSNDCFCCLVFSLYLFRTKSHCVAQACLELTENFLPLSFPTAGISGLYHHAQLNPFIKKKLK